MRVSFTLFVVLAIVAVVVEARPRSIIVRLGKQLPASASPFTTATALSVRAPLHGNLSILREYTVAIKLGTPPMPLVVQLDSGAEYRRISSGLN